MFTMYMIDVLYRHVHVCTCRCVLGGGGGLSTLLAE